MITFVMRFGAGIAVLAGVAVLVSGQAGTARPASTEHEFVIPGGDGYGTSDCLASPGNGCGRLIADAWCEANGFARSDSYRALRSDETTASTTGLVQPAYLIACAK